MKKIFFLAIIITCISYVTIDVKTKSYENKKVMYQMSYENGIMNGNFVSWYPNGKKKAEGKMENNRRIGLWTVFDTLGNIRMQRTYKSPFEFEILAAFDSKGTKLTFNKIKLFPVKRDSLRLNKYYNITEKEVLWSTRIWRELKNDNSNYLFFQNQTLFNIIWKTVIETNEIEAFAPESDQLQEKLDIEQVKNKWNKDCQIVGYKILEDCFYNTSLQMMETRILAICPTVENKTSGETYDLCWIYYPQLRPYLAKEKVSLKAERYLQHLEDVFYMRQFSSTIYKQENMYDRPIAAYKQGMEIQKEAEFIEFTILDAEHNFWLQQTMEDKK